MLDTEDINISLLSYKNMTNAYAFLTKIPNQTLITFAERLFDKYNMQIYIFIDDNNYHINKSEKIHFIKINADECRKHHICCTSEINYFNTRNLANTMVNAWDKALFYFMYINTSYEYVWFIEDDVFISSDEALIDIDKEYPNSDLLTSSNSPSKRCEVDNNEWFWNYAIYLFGFPAYCSMVCACRMSKNMLQTINAVAQQIGCIPYIEFSFNTIAMRAKLKVECPEQLSTLLYKKEWSIEDMKTHKNNLFHPIKDYHRHDILRESIKTT
jgi:hypothetical protein